MIAETPQPPYYAVIFTSILSDDNEGYEDTASLMLDLAKQEDGFLGVESARTEIGITVSYWSSLAAIKHWKDNLEHSIAQEKGKTKWYKSFKVRICKVERDYDFHKNT